jgi:hypothetical protein
MNTGSYVNGKWYQPKAKVGRHQPADTDDVIADSYASTADVKRSMPHRRLYRMAQDSRPERGRYLACG